MFQEALEMRISLVKILKEEFAFGVEAADEQ